MRTARTHGSAQIRAETRLRPYRARTGLAARPWHQAKCPVNAIIQLCGENPESRRSRDSRTGILPVTGQCATAYRTGKMPVLLTLSALGSELFCPSVTEQLPADVFLA